MRSSARFAASSSVRSSRRRVFLYVDADTRGSLAGRCRRITVLKYSAAPAPMLRVARAAGPMGGVRTLIAAALLAWLVSAVVVASCYKTTDAPPCANIENCGNPADLPPPSRLKADGGCTTIGAEIDLDAGAQLDDAGVYHYRARPVVAPCKEAR